MTKMHSKITKTFNLKTENLKDKIWFKILNLCLHLTNFLDIKLNF